MDSPIKFSASLKINVVDGKLQKIYEIGSLQEMSVLAMGICLYRYFWVTHHNAHRTILQYSYTLVNTVLKIRLPLSTKRQLLAVVRPLRTEIVLCRYLLLFMNSFKVNADDGDETMKLIGTKFFVLNELIWTCKGKIDMRKTAEVLVENKRYNLTFRYALACFYCLESWIYKLWPVVPNLGLKKMTNKFYLFRYWDRLSEAKIMSKPTYYHPYVLILNFYRAALLDNLAAMEYFVCKLDPKNIKQATMEIGKIYLQDYFYHDSCYDVHPFGDLIEFRKECKREKRSFMHLERGDLFELASPLITNEEKLSLANEYPRAAFTYSLFWNEEGKIFELANSLYPFAEVSDVLYILNTLIEIKSFGCKNFHKFWLSVPKSMRGQISVYEMFTLPILFNTLCCQHDQAKSYLRLFYKYFSKNSSEMSETDFILFKLFLFVSKSSSDELLSLQVIIINELFLRRVDETDVGLLVRYLNNKFTGTFSELCEVYYDVLKN